MMVPDGWYPGYNNPTSEQLVNEYVKQYGGPRSGVNSDVAEAYSVGQIMQQAVIATGGTNNAQIIAYLHSGVTLTSVQGKVTFDALGENGAAAVFVFQWQQNGDFDQGRRPGDTGSGRRSLPRGPLVHHGPDPPVLPDPDGRRHSGPTGRAVGLISGYVTR